MDENQISRINFAKLEKIQFPRTSGCGDETFPQMPQSGLKPIRDSSYELIPYEGSWFPLKSPSCDMWFFRSDWWSATDAALANHVRILPEDDINVIKILSNRYSPQNKKSDISDQDFIRINLYIISLNTRIAFANVFAYHLPRGPSLFWRSRPRFSPGSWPMKSHAVLMLDSWSLGRWKVKPLGFEVGDLQINCKRILGGFCGQKHADTYYGK